jgi:hypothetical protein
MLFVHIFCRRTMPYHFEGDGWMAQHFFTGQARVTVSEMSGGTMPSHDLLVRFLSPSRLHRQLKQQTLQLYFQSHLTLVRSWYISGLHYSRTCED